LQETLFEMLPMEQREIEIFRESIGLKEAFLQTGAALENPGMGKIFVPVYPAEQPAEHVVLLDNLGRK